MYEDSGAAKGGQTELSLPQGHPGRGWPAWGALRATRLTSGLQASGSCGVNSRENAMGNSENPPLLASSGGSLGGTRPWGMSGHSEQGASWTGRSWG